MTIVITCWISSLCSFSYQESVGLKLLFKCLKKKKKYFYMLNSNCTLGRWREIVNEKTQALLLSITIVIKIHFIFTTNLWTITPVIVITLNILFFIQFSFQHLFTILNGIPLLIHNMLKRSPATMMAKGMKVMAQPRGMPQSFGSLMEKLARGLVRCSWDTTYRVQPSVHCKKLMNFINDYQLRTKLTGCKIAIDN